MSAEFLLNRKSEISAFLKILDLNNKQNFDSLKSEISNNNNTAIFIIHPTWVTRENPTAFAYYKSLDQIKLQDFPKIVFFESETENDISNEFLGEKIFGVLTVSEADAKPLLGWDFLKDLINSTNLEKVLLVGQNINFWTDVDIKQISKEVLDFNIKYNDSLNKIGSCGQIVYPVQCLGSFWLKLSSCFPELKIEISNAIYPAKFVNHCKK